MTLTIGQRVTFHFYRPITKYSTICVIGQSYIRHIRNANLCPEMGRPTKADQICWIQAELHISSTLFDFEVQPNAVPIVRRDYQYNLGKTE